MRKHHEEASRAGNGRIPEGRCSLSRAVAVPRSRLHMSACCDVPTLRSRDTLHGRDGSLCKKKLIETSNAPSLFHYHVSI